MNIQSNNFRDEEAYMEKIRYPEIDAQKKAHASFINELAKLKSEYENQGGNALVILNANKMVINWLTNHIKVMDKKIGDSGKNSLVNNIFKPFSQATYLRYDFSAYL